MKGVQAVVATVMAVAGGWGVSACGMGVPNLRPTGTQLAPCSKAQCVSSQQPGTRWFVEPLHYPGSREAAHSALLQIISGVPGAQVEQTTDTYVHATFTSSLMRYVDDVELRFVEGQRTIHVRSASRLGYYDFDVNRDRVEAIREAFDAIQP